MANANGRNVFSVNVTDDKMADHIKMKSVRHPSGLSGYFRDLVEADIRRWKETEELRMQALLKLTAAEREALGFEWKNPK